jgi:hypothetical protein
VSQPQPLKAKELGATDAIGATDVVERNLEACLDRCLLEIKKGRVMAAKECNMTTMITAITTTATDHSYSYSHSCESRSCEVVKKKKSQARRRTKK